MANRSIGPVLREPPVEGLGTAAAQFDGREREISIQMMQTPTRTLLKILVRNRFRARRRAPLRRSGGINPNLNRFKVESVSAAAAELQRSGLYGRCGRRPFTMAATSVSWSLERSGPFGNKEKERRYFLPPPPSSFLPPPPPPPPPIHPISPQ